MRPMHWVVFVDNINTRSIETFDVFQHARFAEDVRKAYKRYKDDFAAFGEDVRKYLAYYFWSKCEWEVIVSAWPPTNKISQRKIDVYDQVTNNWDIFIEYVWTMCHARKRRGE